MSDSDAGLREPVRETGGAKLRQILAAQRQQSAPAQSAETKPVETVVTAPLVEQPVEAAQTEALPASQPETIMQKEKPEERPPLKLFFADDGTQISVQLGEPRRTQDKRERAPLTSEDAPMTNIQVPAPNPEMFPDGKYPNGTLIAVNTRPAANYGPAAQVSEYTDYFMVTATNQPIPNELNPLAVKRISKEEYTERDQERVKGDGKTPLLVVGYEDLNQQAQEQKIRINTRNMGSAARPNFSVNQATPRITQEVTTTQAPLDIQHQKVPFWAQGLHAVGIHTRFDQAIQDNEILASTTAARGREEQGRQKERQQWERTADALVALEEKRAAQHGLTRDQVLEYQAQQTAAAAAKSAEELAHIREGKVARTDIATGETTMDQTGGIKAAQRTLAETRAAGTLKSSS